MSLFDLFSKPIVYPRVVAWGPYVGELEADGREIRLPHGVVILPAGATVRDATQREACGFYSAREAAERGLAEWYDRHPNTCD